MEKGGLVRLTGWILLLIGAVLCASVAWAAIGFLLMGVGLIALQVAERGRRRADFAVATPPGLDRALKSPGLQPPKFEPVGDFVPTRQARRVAWPAKSSGDPYDKEAWRLLVERDPDLARLVHVLADYGPQYVDELAISYLAVPDKSRLGTIVDGIIARARDSQAAAPPAPAPAPGSRPPPSPRPEPQVAVTAEEVQPGASRPSAPADPADALEASLIAAVAEASARPATARIEPPKPTRREPAFGSVPKDLKSDLTSAPEPDRSPPPLPAGTPSDLVASLIAAVAESSVNRADPPKPVSPPERPAVAARREPEIRSPPKEVKPAPVPPPLSSASAALEASLLAAIEEASAKRTDPPKPVSPPERAAVAVKREPGVGSAPKDPKPAPPASPADDLDETLLAALAEISGQKLAGASNPAKPEAPKDTAKDVAKDPAKDPTKYPPGAPVDDHLGEMIKKFAPDSSFLRKQ